MNNLYNTIALKYKQSLVIDKSTGKIPAIHTLGLLLDISQLGYTLNGDTLKIIRTLKETEFKQLHTTLIENLKIMVGANVKYSALFRNFPNDIPNDTEYLVKRFVGYISQNYDLSTESTETLSCGHVIHKKLFNLKQFGACPICQYQVDELNDDESDRQPLEDITPLKVIGLITEENVKQIFVNLLTAKSSTSENDKNVIEHMLKEDPSLFTYVPNIIPIKENVAVVTTLAVEYKYNGDGDDFSQAASNILILNIKTATDVLRLAVKLNNGDVSLSDNTRIKLSNKNRHVIMWLLNEIKNPEEDMLRYKMRWIRLAEVIHIGKFAKKYPNAYKACDILRNRSNTIKTFNNKVEACINSINTNNPVFEETLIKLLVTRPGEFARRMDWMLRTFKSKENIITAFNGLIGKLTTPMLLTLNTHFTNRSIKSDERYFMPKSSLAKVQVMEDKRSIIDASITLKINKEINKELLYRFSKLDTLGKVYINEDLKNYLVPLVQRNASKSLVTIARGSQIPLMETSVARLFLYWKNNESKIDVDLSTISFDENWNYVNHISYTNLSDVGSKHSGDIQSAPNGAAEFVDINIKETREHNIRYVVMNVISFSGQPFDTFECFAGVMERDQAETGKKFEPKTVTNRFDITGNTKYNIPFIFDLETNKIIWSDISLKVPPHSNVESESNKIVQMSKAIKSMIDDKPNMFDLVCLHATSRAESIDYEFQEGKKYDTILDVDMATNIDEILAKWL